jgi:hypothetical protein
VTAGATRAAAGRNRGFIMSLRPMIYASDVDRLHAVFGSGDEALAAKVAATLEERVDKKAHEPALRAVAGDLRKAVMEGVPVKGLRDETELHAVAIDALAGHLGLDHPDAMVHDGDWKHGAWEDYLDEAGEALDKATGPLMEYLVHGRALLGEGIRSGWSYYAYLSLDEVVRLCDGLTVSARKHPEIADEDFIDGFHNELVGWLDSILKRKKALWLYAS